MPFTLPTIEQIRSSQAMATVIRFASAAFYELTHIRIGGHGVAQSTPQYPIPLTAEATSIIQRLIRAGRLFDLSLIHI